MYAAFCQTCVTVALCLIVAGSDAYPYQRGLPSVLVKIGEHQLLAEVAATPDQWRRGLSFRHTLDSDGAMLFVFNRSQRLGFSVRNTLIPLAVAFIDEAGIITQINQLARPYSPYVASSDNARFAIEANAGWFSQHRIVPGQKVSAFGYIGL